MRQQRVSRVKAIAAAICGAVAAWTAPAQAQQVNVETYTLDNGMKFLLYPRHEEPNIIAAGWVAKVGSVNEHPGITGISHFFEHMMFKGTNTIGTSDPKKDAELRAKQSDVRNRLLAMHLDGQYKRWKAGEIDDPWDARNDTPEMKALRTELAKLMEEQKQLTVKNEFDKVYTQAGASGMNAFTEWDMTFYFINVPSNKLEMWAWMESDRLTDSVFREFYAERDVVHEERRLRTESTPTGVFQEEFDALFWESSPYSWPVIGWTSDLNSYTMDEALNYYGTYYRPGNIVGVIVGDFDPEAAKPMLKKYFSRLSAGDKPVPPVVTLEMPQLAEKRMVAECDCQPEVEVRYHTVPFNHADSFALQVMADVLNGRTGRLYKSMVEGKAIAAEGASASTEERKLEGYFSFSAQTKGEASTPEQLEQAWYAELDRLKSSLVDEKELQKVKNQLAANNYRRLQNDFFILLQLGMMEARGGWEYINTSPARLQAVTPQDIQRVANKYFDVKNRSVALYHRKAGTGVGEDPELAKLNDLGPQVKNMIQAQVKQLQSETSIDNLRQGLAQFEQMKDRMPPKMRPAGDYLKKKVEERIAELEKNPPAATAPANTPAPSPEKK